MMDGDYPRVDVVGPDGWGHPGQLEIVAAGEVVRPDSEVIPEGARVVLALDDPWFFRQSYGDPDNRIPDPDIGDVPVDVVWLPWWRGQLPEVSLTFDSRGALTAEDTERQLRELVVASSADFERELRRAWDGASPEMRELHGADYESTIPQRAGLGAAGHMSATTTVDGRVAIHLDFGGGVIGAGERLLALWIQTAARLVAAHRIDQIIVGVR